MVVYVICVIHAFLCLQISTYRATEKDEPAVEATDSSLVTHKKLSQQKFNSYSHSQKAIAAIVSLVKPRTKSYRRNSLTYIVIDKCYSSNISCNLLRGTEEKTKVLIHDIQYPRRNLKWVSQECKPVMFPLEIIYGVLCQYSTLGP
jgi:hypothetical protein